MEETSTRPRPKSAIDRTPLAAKLHNVDLFGHRRAPSRPVSAVERLISRTTDDPLGQYKKRNLFRSHARRLQSKETNEEKRSEIDDQLDMLAKAMRQKESYISPEEKRTLEMAAHISMRQKAMQRGAVNRSSNERRPTVTASTPKRNVQRDTEHAGPITVPSKQVAEAIKSCSHGATHENHANPETEAEQWLEQMWVAKRTKDLINKRYDDQVKQALEKWEQEKYRRDREFEKRQEQRKIMRQGIIKYPSTSARPSSNTNKAEDWGKEEFEDALAETLALFEKTQVVPDGSGPGPIRQRSAGCVEDLKRQLVALPKERAKSMGDVNDFIFQQPPMRFQYDAPKHLAQQRKLVRTPSNLSQGGVSSLEEESQTDQAKDPRTSQLDDERVEQDNEKELLKKRLKKSGSGKSLLFTKRSKSFSAKPERAAALNYSDKEYIIYEQARLERLPSYRVKTKAKTGKVSSLISELCHNQMDECDKIYARFEAKGLSIDKEVLRKALVVPADRAEHQCVRNLPLPGSKLRSHPLQAQFAAEKAAAASKKKGSKKKKGTKKK